MHQLFDLSDDGRRLFDPRTFWRDDQHREVACVDFWEEFGCKRGIEGAGGDQRDRRQADHDRLGSAGRPFKIGSPMAINSGTILHRPRPHVPRLCHVLLVEPGEHYRVTDMDTT